MDGPPEHSKPPPVRVGVTRQQLAAIIVMLGAAWTLLTGACTGGFALFTTGVALIFGGPLVLGGAAVWLAGALLRRDPMDEAVREWARIWAVVAALGTTAAIVLAAWSAGETDELGLGPLMALFAAAGAVGGLVLLAASLRTVLAGGKRR
jgi:hypothetical protein